MRTLGLASAGKFHEENKSFPFNWFQLKDDSTKHKDGKGTAIVRVLASAEPDYDKNGNPVDNDKIVIQSFQVHKEFGKFERTRCVSDGFEKDPANCPLCRAGIRRTMETYIWVAVHTKDGSKLSTPSLQVIQAGREMLQSWIGMLEEMPKNDITSMDVKIKRIGEGKDTKYQLFLVHGSERPLNDAEVEMAKTIPDMDEIIELKSLSELEKLAVNWERNTTTKPVDEGTTEDDQIPF